MKPCELWQFNGQIKPNNFNNNCTAKLRIYFISEWHKAKSRNTEEIQDKKSKRDTASSVKLVSTIGAEASPKKGGGTTGRCPEG